MIYLITLAPAIDNYITIDNVITGQTNYSNEQHIKFGGKAINVAKILKEFGIDSKLITTTSKLFNDFITSELDGLDYKLINTPKIRINSKIIANNNLTEINSQGEALNERQIIDFNNFIVDNVTKSDIVLIAGNPHPNNYSQMIQLCQNVKKQTDYLFLDTSKVTLQDIKKIKPYFIKPNVEEIENLLNIKLDKSNIKEQISELHNYIDYIMVSLGEDGIYYSSKMGDYQTQKITGNLINPVGAGDSAVGAAIYSFVKQYSLEKSAILSASTGSATAFNRDLATKREINEIYESYIKQYGISNI